MTATLQALATFPAQLEAQFDCFPERHRDWRPPSWDGIPSEKLTAIEQLCHLRDIEIEGYQVRFHRTRAEDKPLLPDLPGESMAQERGYSHANARDVLKEFTDARAATVAQIRSFSDAELARLATFEGRPVTLAALVHFLCSHDYQHLAGLQWLLARLSDPE